MIAEATIPTQGSEPDDELVVTITVDVASHHRLVVIHQASECVLELVQRDVLEIELLPQLLRIVCQDDHSRTVLRCTGIDYLTRLDDVVRTVVDEPMHDRFTDIRIGRLASHDFPLIVKRRDNLFGVDAKNEKSSGVSPLTTVCSAQNC